MGGGEDRGGVYAETVGETQLDTPLSSAYGLRETTPTQKEDNKKNICIQQSCSAA